MAGFFDSILRPVLFRLDPETAHDLAISAMRRGLGSAVARRAARSIYEPEFRLGPIRRFGLDFRNPLGIAAGFDKNGVVADQLGALGFGFVEVGTVTRRPQPGNPKPRLFRFPADRALINRFGFNNDGIETVAARLGRIARECVVGVNIGKNKDVELANAVEDYCVCFRRAFAVADYLVVNVSSPNTPNLRDLQRPESLDELLSALQEANLELGSKPLLLKIAPDLSDGDVESIAEIAVRYRLSGIIATNTTISRDGLSSATSEAGGLSGAPLRERSTEVIRRLYRLAGHQLTIIGVGGIFSAEDAFAKIVAGASLVQAYTGFIYGGPRFAKSVVEGLGGMLAERGFTTFDEAVGSESAAATASGRGK